LAELPDELKLLLVLGYHYGIRKGELLTYRWDYVSWFAKELRIPQSDTKNPRSFRLRRRPTLAADGEVPARYFVP
jgi:integrase